MAAQRFLSHGLSLKFEVCWSWQLVIVIANARTRGGLCNEGIGEGVGIDDWHSCGSGRNQLFDLYDPNVRHGRKGLGACDLEHQAARGLRSMLRPMGRNKNCTVSFHTSLITVLWSLRSGLGTQFREPGGGFGGRRGGLEVR